MPSSHEPDELAAVVADGRPFDWTAIGDARRHRPLQALWKAVRQRDGGRAARPATRAPLRAPLFLLTVVALAKAGVTAVAVGLAIQSVNLVQFATLGSFTLVGAVLIYGGHPAVPWGTERAS